MPKRKENDSQHHEAEARQCLTGDMLLLTAGQSRDDSQCTFQQRDGVAVQHCQNAANEVRVSKQKAGLQMELLKIQQNFQNPIPTQTYTLPADNGKFVILRSVNQPGHASDGVTHNVASAEGVDGEAESSQNATNGL